MSIQAETAEAFLPNATAPLVAVCGVGGGTGTSTLAFLTALHVQRVSSEPILLADTGGPGASLAMLAEKSSKISLPQAAAAIGADALGVPLFTSLTAKLRLIAREPDLDDPLDPEGLARLLEDARGAHPITIVDCGTLQRPVERAVAAQASSILWTTRGTLAGAERALTVLKSLPLCAHREVLAVCAGEERNSLVERRLMGAADLRGASVVFVPTLPEVRRAGWEAVLEAGQLALEGIRVRLT